MNSIIVEKYNSEWPQVFEHLKHKIKLALNNENILIEHVGSTAVPGLFAKPVIDIDIVVMSSKESLECIRSLETLGYIHRGDLGVPGREAFRRPPNSPHHNLYVCLDSSVAFKNHIALRDFLRKNDDARNEYSELKIKLAKEFAGDIDGYCRAKTTFIISILKQCNLSPNDLNEIIIANT